MIEIFAGAGLSGDLAQVEAAMAAALASDEPRVSDLIDSLGSFHGKMLRPSVVLLVASAIGANGAGGAGIANTISSDHHRLSAALEMIHTATLIHDDMIDEADTRRGKPTAHVSHGTNVAVLLGDYFYTHAFSLVAAIGQQWVMERLTATTNLICSGELHQMIARRDVHLSEDEYDRIIYAKTAALTELAGELGALTASREVRSAAAAYGRCCGMAFQIVDDCLDFSGDPLKVGKTLATDIERGRMTLPILRLIKRTEPQRRAELSQRLVSATSAAEIADVRHQVMAGGGVDDALGTAKAYVQQAKSALRGLPPGAARDRLGELAEFIVARDF